VNIEAIQSAYYLRCYAKDQAGVLAKVSTVLAEYDISAEHIHQEPNAANPDEATLVMTTSQVQESTLNQAIKELESMDEIDGQVMRIRIASMD
ncbi:MAG: ACT domain-containing protein, partial [Hydrogenovibrio sp.]|nr:ACT domain-containing protein [Hydrogenovibrio sp.]